MKHARFVVILGTLCLGACGGAGDETTAPPVDPANLFLFTTAEFSLEAGEEKFLCHAITLEEDIVIDRFSFPGAPYVHHLILSETVAPEPEGLTECDVLFRTTWLPEFVAGTGESTIEAPAGAGYHFKAGTQLVLQLHLLNAQPTPVTDTVTIDMRKAKVGEELAPVGIKVFGNLAIALPPNSPSEVVGTCTLQEDWDVFAVFPHMHYLGTSMVVEAGPTEDALEEVFRRDPYDFDDQRLDAQPISLPKGHHVRVTCQFDNTTDEVVTFGESTHNEMCFFLVYGAGVETDLGGCLGGGGMSGILPAGCGDEPPNNLGLGAACSPKGGECNEGLLCSADLIESGDGGVCLSMGQCETATDCGDGEAMCCSLEFGDSPFKLCLAKGCGIPGCNFL